MKFPTRIENFQRASIVLTLGLAGAVLLAWAGSPVLQWTYLTTIVVVVLALAVDIWRRAATLSEYGELLSTPLLLAQDQQILDLYRSVASSLRDISAHFDPIYHDLAVQRVQQLDRELVGIAQGQIVFTGTETWRMSYERILRSRGLHLYRSVAYAKTADYWQDEPGRQSMQVNFALLGEGKLDIQRIVIVPDQFWPMGESFPLEPLATWLDEQHRHGLSLQLVRLSCLSNEPDLVADFGIYGNRALGLQDVNDQGRTVRFTLSFDFTDVLAAEKRWQRLSLYATPYRDLLDQSTSRE